MPKYPKLAILLSYEGIGGRMSQNSHLIATPRSIQSLNGVPWAFKTIARQLLHIKAGALNLRLPNGQEIVFKGQNEGPQAVMHIHNYRFIARLLRSGDIGFAEGYMAGEWTSPDLANVLITLSANLDHMRGIATGRNVFVRLLNRLFHRFNANTRSGAKRNIAAHYDLGNSFYEAWLDPSMTYSSALFSRPDMNLEEAQRQKYKAMAEGLELSPGDRVLEIGCGWGGFCEYVAREIGAHITGITLSKEQLDYARARMQRTQVSDKVDLKRVDYRDVEGQYDKIASIEMFEAVGEEYWPGFFAKIRQCLKPAGRANLQIITIRDDLFALYAKRTDFIQRYIFPGGVLPSLSRLKSEFDRAGLKVHASCMFGHDYVKTLSLWSDNFTAQWDRIARLGFDIRFKRLWTFYLAYCAAGFASGRTDVGQFVLQK